MAGNSHPTTVTPVLRLPPAALAAAAGCRRRRGPRRTRRSRRIIRKNVSGSNRLPRRAVVQMGEDDLRLGVKHVALVAGGRDHRPFRADVLDLRGVRKRVAGRRRAIEHGLGQLGQHHLLGELVVLADQQPARLRHPLDHQRIGNHRVEGKMVVQILLGQRDVLDGLGVPPALKLDESIDPIPSHGTPPSP